MWVRRLVGKTRRTDLLERAVLLQGTCPGCNLPTRSIARPFSLVLGPEAVPSLRASLLEASGLGHWRSCSRSHEWLVGIEWRRAATRCWRCQRPHGTAHPNPPCPTCSAAVDFARISEDYEDIVAHAAVAMGLDDLSPEAFQYLDWTHEPEIVVEALLGHASRSTPEAEDSESAPSPPRPRASLPALREIYGGSRIVEGSVRYSLLGLLGTGGFSKVHLTLSPDGRFVVLKEAWGFRTAEEKGKDGRLNAYPLAARKLRAEAEYLRQLAGNARIAQFVEHFERDGTAYLAMEFIHGPNLREYGIAMAATPDGGLEVGEALRIFKQAADVVRVIHGTHKVHRDLTPRNFLMRAGNPILIDFGTIASDTGPTVEVATGISAGGYHSPEQARGVASRLCDIFSLGSCLYFLLTGKDPPQAAPNGRAEQGMAEEMARRGIPVAVQSIVRTARAWNPSERFASVDQMMTVLHLFEHPEIRTCSRCGAYVELHQRFCAGCGLRHCSSCGTAVGPQPQCPTCTRVFCPWCETTMEPKAEFCPGCGTTRETRTCGKCGQLVPGGSAFCRSCGGALSS